MKGWFILGTLAVVATPWLVALGDETGKTSGEEYYEEKYAAANTKLISEMKAVYPDQAPPCLPVQLPVCRRVAEQLAAEFGSAAIGYIKGRFDRGLSHDPLAIMMLVKLCPSKEAEELLFQRMKRTTLSMNDPLTAVSYGDRATARSLVERIVQEEPDERAKPAEHHRWVTVHAGLLSVVGDEDSLRILRGVQKRFEQQACDAAVLAELAWLSDNLQERLAVQPQRYREGRLDQELRFWQVSRAFPPGRGQPRPLWEGEPCTIIAKGFHQMGEGFSPILLRSRLQYEPDREKMTCLHARCDPAMLAALLLGSQKESSAIDDLKAIAGGRDGRGWCARRALEEIATEDVAARRAMQSLLEDASAAPHVSKTAKEL